MVDNIRLSPLTCSIVDKFKNYSCAAVCRVTHCDFNLWYKILDWGIIVAKQPASASETSEKPKPAPEKAADTNGAPASTATLDP